MQLLQPFEQRPDLATCQLRGAAIWRSGKLRLTFVFHGPTHTLKLPAAAGAQTRRDGLWQSTCFEAFIGCPGDQAYWEFNLAPNGDWNFYALSGYRENLRPVSLMSAPAYCLRRSSSQLEIACELDLSPLMAANQELELSLTAVLEQQQLGCSYWAWHHCGAAADFHIRDSFQRLRPDQA